MVTARPSLVVMALVASAISGCATELPADGAARGAVLFKNCVQCHGERGAGDGFSAAKLRVAPADLGGQRPSLAESLRVLRNGIDGTQMAPWTSRLTEAELVAVAHFVRGFYAGEPAAGGGR